MDVDLNKDQASGLSNFFFDIAKGLFLGGVGSFAVSNLQIGISISIINAILAYFCVNLALRILKNNG